PMIERTIEELNFGVAFYREGNVLTTEIYEIPVRATVIRDNNGKKEPRQMYFKAVDERQFELTARGEDGEHLRSEVFNFADTIAFEGMRAVFSWKNGHRKEVVGEPYIFT